METLAVIFSEFDLLLIEKLHGPMAKLWSADSMIIGLNPRLAKIFHFLLIFVNRGNKGTMILDFRLENYLFNNLPQFKY